MPHPVLTDLCLILYFTTIEHLTVHYNAVNALHEPAQIQCNTKLRLYPLLVEQQTINP
jgi:hypothetical protein